MLISIVVGQDQKTAGVNVLHLTIKSYLLGRIIAVYQAAGLFSKCDSSLNTSLYQAWLTNHPQMPTMLHVTATKPKTDKEKEI